MNKFTKKDWQVVVEGIKTFDRIATHEQKMELLDILGIRYKRK